MMEGKEETRVFKEDERYKEKIVYKIIPVPYYYPVPVDAEWYHKNYERQFRPSEFTSFPFVDTSVEHFVPPPPPGFPYPRFRHPHHQHHFVYEPSNKRGMSPPPQARNNARQSDTSPKRPVHSKCNEVPHVVSTNENGVVIDTIDNVCASSKYTLTTASENNNDDIDRNKDPRSAAFDNILIKSEIDDNETVIVNGVESPKKGILENNEIESIRDRKRYLMTFPYDQKKKVKVNGHSEPEHETVKHVVCGKEETNNKADESGETHYTVVPSQYPNVPTIPTGHKAVLSQTVPYVMVPVQNPAFLHPPKVVHQSMQQASFATEHSRTFSAGKLSPEIHDLKKELAEGANQGDNQGDVKYHPNGRRARTVFTRQQLLTLNNVFEKHHFVSGERMSELSDQLGLDRKIVKIWFQNKRQYSRKKGSLLEREEDFFEYHEMDNFTSAPTMTMLNNHNRTMDDLKKYEENLYKVSVLSDDYKPDYTDVKLCQENAASEENINYEHEGDKSV